MTPIHLIIALLASMLLAGAVVLVLRSRVHTRRSPDDPGELALTFDTSTARTRDGWATFWARDPFVQGQRERTGMPFGRYAVPGGESIVTRLADSDAFQHTLVLGATGSGKSSLLEMQARYFIRERRPFTLIDLHGDLYTRVAAWALFHKVERLVLLDFTRPHLLPAWNPFTHIEGVDVGRHVDMLVSILKRLFASEEAASWAWGVKVEELIRYAMLACISAHAAGVVYSLADLPSFFLIDTVRQRVLHALPEDHPARVYFTTRYGARERMYASAALNKLEPFLGGSTGVQAFLGQKDSTFDLMGAIDRGDTVIVNLAKGNLPRADVLGRFLVNVFQVAALRRERLVPEKRRPYALILDEAHVLADEDSGLEDFLVAARKYKVAVTVAAQGLSLFPAKFRPHLLGNTGRQFFFRLPYSEARSLANDIFEPLGSVFREQILPNERIEEPLLAPAEEIAWRTRDLANLPVGACYWLLKGRPYKARPIEILPPLKLPYRARELAKRIDAAMIVQRSEGSATSADDLSTEIRTAIADRHERHVENAVGIHIPKGA